MLLAMRKCQNALNLDGDFVACHEPSYGGDSDNVIESDILLIKT